MTACHRLTTGLQTPTLAEALESAHADLSLGCVKRLDALVDLLDQARRSLAPNDWNSAVCELVRPHPVTRLIQQEPFTRRAFAKPRGYAGDAGMLDLVYGEGPLPDDLTPLGRRLHLWAVEQPACRSVRLRRDLLAKALDDVAREVESPRILALACGHLREAMRSYALRTGGIAELVAIDQDEESLTEVRRSLERYSVRAVAGSVRDILTGNGPSGEFDFVYAAGLYDYLPHRTASVLTGRLFRLLGPGGRLLIPNFAPSLRDIGYMEAVMDWYLIYRDEEAMMELADACPAGEIASVRTFRDEPRNVVYLDVRRV